MHGGAPALGWRRGEVEDARLDVAELLVAATSSGWASHQQIDDGRPAAVRAGRGAGGGGKAGDRARVRLRRGHDAGVRGGRDMDAEAYGCRTPAESRPGAEQLGPDGLRGGLVAEPAGWTGSAGLLGCGLRSSSGPGGRDEGAQADFRRWVEW
jgi:hypothetical protein